MTKYPISGFFHASIPTLAFGGVGTSGSGSYRGRASFDCFTHRRSITTTPGWMEGLLAVRYPPYKGKTAKYKQMSELKPNFDRDGKVKVGIVKWILALGAGSTSGAFGRYLVVALREFSISPERIFLWAKLTICSCFRDQAISSEAVKVVRT
jgi:beta-apo-4'-carotenal oxygenase